MKKVKLKNIDANNSYFHFTKEESIADIKENGLTSEPPERENAVAKDREKPCIYFSVGTKGLLETIDVWIRWEYNNMARKKKMPAGYIEMDVKILKKVYEKVYKDFKKRKYLKLDLEEGEDVETSDFSFLGIDYKKEMALKTRCGSTSS